MDGNDELTEVSKPGAADRKSVTGDVLMSEERGEALQKLLVLPEQFARRFEVLPRNQNQDEEDHEEGKEKSLAGASRHASAQTNTPPVAGLYRLRMRAEAARGFMGDLARRCMAHGNFLDTQLFT
jgi:hypothetical protein